jgi:hypothetical protein
MMHVRIVRRYQRGNQSPLIEEEQIREWSKENISVIKLDI